MSNAYDPQLIRLAQRTAAALGHGDFVHEGCYAMQMGPSYETAAEYRMILRMGADCIGRAISFLPQKLLITLQMPTYIAFY